METRHEISRLGRGSSNTRAMDTAVPNIDAQLAEEADPAERHGSALPSSLKSYQPEVEPASRVGEDGLAPVLDRIPEDLLEFAEWVFEPEGIPSLQVLAYAITLSGPALKSITSCFAEEDGKSRGDQRRIVKTQDLALCHFG
jgi:hypothetical protein